MNITKTSCLSFYNDQGILTLNAKQFDTGRRFIFHIMDNDEPFDLTGCMVYLRIAKADGTEFQGGECCSTDGSKIIINPAVGNGSQILTAAGTNICELHLEDANGITLTTWNFNINVEKRVHNGNNLASTDSYDVLDNIVKTEKVRVINENKRIENENQRERNERKRIENEDQRVQNENLRKQNEQSRQDKENSRISKENQRIQNEAERIENEQIRQNQESDRVSEESQRILDENLRKQNEQSRQDKENSRISKENQRIQNEAERIENEANRQSTFTQSINKVNTTISNCELVINQATNKIENFDNEINQIVNEITNRAENFATTASICAFQANESAVNADISQKSAATSASIAAFSVLEAESWAHGRTGIREGENTDNSEFYCRQSELYKNESKIIVNALNNCVICS